MTWKQFKEYWEDRTEGSWIFDDLKNTINKQLFKKAWDITGREICNKHGMKFVQANTMQNQITMVQPTHYIFALEHTIAMRG